MSVLKSLKDFRRRSVETVLELAGASETTVDEEFDIYAKKFAIMMADMNECGAALSASLGRQQQSFNDAEELSNVLEKIYQKNLEMNDWPGVTNDLPSLAACLDLKSSWDYINNVLRTSSLAVCNELALQPLCAAVTKMEPDIQTEFSDRALKVKDFDSYRRRLKGLESKRDNFEAQGKSTTAAALENSAEITRFEAKLETSRNNYEKTNKQSKVDVLMAKKAHDVTMENLLVTFIVTQAELFSKAAERLEECLSKLPPQRVNQARDRMRNFVRMGGVKQDEPAAPTGSGGMWEKSVAVLSGKATLSEVARQSKEDTERQLEQLRLQAEMDFEAASENKDLPVASPVRSVATSVASESLEVETRGNPFDSPSPSPSPVRTPSVSTPPPPPPPPPSAPPAPPSQVVGIFDHVAEDVDELDFRVGDVIDVLDASDPGWWRGCFNGKEGLFPVNYVKQL